MLRGADVAAGKSSYAGGGQIADVRRASPRAMAAFRANLFVPEGARASTAIINQQDGVVLQDLPFDVELKKFIVEYYETGMPRLFASEIVIHDRDTGRRQRRRPSRSTSPPTTAASRSTRAASDDGGSARDHAARAAVTGAGQPFDVEGVVGGATTLAPAGSDPAKPPRARSSPACA